MTLSKKTVLICILSPLLLKVAIGQCPLIAPDEWNDVGVKVVYDNRVPVTTDGNGYSEYNMMVAENFETLFFIDQLAGIIYEYVDHDAEPRKIFDSTTYVIEGITYYPQLEWTKATKIVHQVAPGKNDSEIYVVFSSDTAPPGLIPLYLPDDPLYYESKVAYKVFVKFDYSNGNLENPTPFFAYEIQVYGHDGGGMLTVGDKILFAIGDCLRYGLNGLEASQDLSSHCGKIMLIDPEDGSYQVAAMGVRNSQQMNLYNDTVVFMDIGGVTAEEVNAIELDALLDTSIVENFGWGMRSGEDFGREGSFKVEEGIVGGYNQPACISVQDDADLAEDNEDNLKTPWMQFGRGPGARLFGISGAIVSESSFDKIKLASTEFNTGSLICTGEELNENYPRTGRYVKLYDEAGEFIGDANALVADDLSLQNPERGDARLFNYPNGDAGLFIERTGTFYKLEEFDIVTPTPEPSPQPTPMPSPQPIPIGTRGSCTWKDCIVSGCTWTECCLFC